MIQDHADYLDAKNEFRLLDTAPEHTPDIAARMDRLAEAIQAYEREVLGVEPLFSVRDEDTLAWYVGRIADLESKKKRIQTQADAMIKDVQRDIDGLQYRFGHQAEGVLRGLLTGRSKTKKFLTGSIGLKKTPARVSVEDAETLLAELPEDLRGWVAEEKVNAALLNRLVKVVDGKAYRVDTGEELNLPGLKVTPEGEKVVVKAGSEE